MRAAGCRDQLGGDDINASEGDKGLSEAVAVGGREGLIWEPFQKQTEQGLVADEMGGAESDVGSCDGLDVGP